ncbi:MULTISPECIES: universal stress protein [unclassified Yoonia]|uniref:universal stress protein n=1 Tax=unclassified Yoonia TaxID=2629118 RepID=UPI002AFE02EB|nr:MULTISPECIES: universal stress protein [unclassified Yoonia]
MTKSVLMPIDLTDNESWPAALREALLMVGNDGILHVISVLPDFGLAQVSGYFKKNYEKEAIKAFGAALTDWINDNVPDSVEVHPHILHGTIYDEILRAANKLAVDVIVMGSHRPAFRDYLLGPNAARVVRHANCSVYVVRS